MTLLLDPKLFNYLILLLFAFATVRWGIEGKWADTLYWACAFGLNVAVTWGYQR